MGSDGQRNADYERRKVPLDAIANITIPAVVACEVEGCSYLILNEQGSFPAYQEHLATHTDEDLQPLREATERFFAVSAAQDAETEERLHDEWQRAAEAQLDAMQQANAVRGLLREARDLLYHEEDVYGSFVHNEDWGQCPGCDLERRIDEHFDGTACE